MLPTSSFHLVPDDGLILTTHLCIIKDQIKKRGVRSVWWLSPTQEGNASLLFCRGYVQNYNNGKAAFYYNPRFQPSFPNIYLLL